MLPARASRSNAPRSSRRIRVEIRGQTRVLKWFPGTTAAELMEQVGDIAHLSGAVAFRLRDKATGDFVELSPRVADGTTLQLVEAESQSLQPAAAATVPAKGGVAAAQSGAPATAESAVPQSWSVVTRIDQDAPAAVELTARSHPELWASLSSQVACVGEVSKIVRCEDADLWSTFVLEKKKLVKRWRARAAKDQMSDEWRCGPGCWTSGAGTQLDRAPRSSGPLEERVLFHTANAPIPAIFEEGFDMRLAAPGNFGRGIYLSDDPRKCDAYWRGQHHDAPRDGSRVIFVAQVLLGESKIYRKGQNDRTLVREPERERAATGSSGFGYQQNRRHSTDRYDSVQGHINTADEFIIYQNSRAYPMFAIEYVPKRRAVSAVVPGAMSFRPAAIVVGDPPGFRWKRS